MSALELCQGSFWGDRRYLELRALSPSFNRLALSSWLCAPGFELLALSSWLRTAVQSVGGQLRHAAAEGPDCRPKHGRVLFRDLMSSEDVKRKGALLSPAEIVKESERPRYNKICPK